MFIIELESYQMLIVARLTGCKVAVKVGTHLYRWGWRVVRKNGGKVGGKILLKKK